MSAPGYWLYETSGVLAPVVEKYLDGRWLDLDEIAIFRRYLAQWMSGPWQGSAVAELRERVAQIRNRVELESWLRDALDMGIDPL